MLDFFSLHWRVILSASVTVLVIWRLSQAPVTLNLGTPPEASTEDDPDPPLLPSVLPMFANELQRLLVDQGEIELATQVPSLRVVDRCRCTDEFCATFYVRPIPEASYVSDHRNVTLTPNDGMLILDVVDGKIACVEVLYRSDVRKVIQSIKWR